MESKITSVKDLKSQFNPPKNLNIVHRNRLSKLEKLALFVTEKIGTMGFFLIIFIWTISWLSWNVLAPSSLRFDPYPAFVLWLFISNMIQLHLMPLLLIGQNIQGKRSEIRAEHDYETDTRSEKEIETILLHLENQEKLLIEIQKKVNK